MGYEKARGAIVWRPGDPSPEQVIRKMRGDHTECEETITDLRRQLERMHELQPCGHEARFIVGSDEGTNWCALCELPNYGEEA